VTTLEAAASDCPLAQNADTTRGEGHDAARVHGKSSKRVCVIFARTRVANVCAFARSGFDKQAFGME
jgi:hypothetical protein